MDEGRKGVLGTRFRWKSDALRVRCLVRLKRYKEAVAEAEAQWKARRGDPLLLVLAHAAGGDVAGAVAAAERLRPGQVSPETWSADEDLGPILRGEAFRPFREKFPERKEKRPSGR
jgi:hypothetical protein